MEVIENGAVNFDVILLFAPCSCRFSEDGEEVQVRAQELEKIEELGRGAYGVVEKMRHRQTNTIMAVKVKITNFLL